jgi:hypothetical protein
VSSTGRGGKRCEADFYETPEWVTARLLDVWKPGRDALLIEPAVGNGAIIKAMNKLLPDPASFWLGYDIRDMAVHHLCRFRQTDFLADGAQLATDLTEVCWGFAEEGKSFRTMHVITNPPFSVAEEFLRKSRLLYPTADLVFLLRLNFLASIERLPLWRDLGVPDVHVLPNRPSFTGAGTDSCEYAWMIFHAWAEVPLLRTPSQGFLTILPETPKTVRAACRKHMIEDP